MDLHPYLENLRRDLTTSAAPGGPDVARAAELLSGSLEASVRLCLLEALSDAAAEITTKLSDATVDVRLRGRSADLVVTEAPPPEAAVPPPSAEAESSDLARITLRLPEALKAAVEHAANSEGVSVNAWLVRAIGSSVHGVPPHAGRRGRPGKRITGFAQA